MSIQIMERRVFFFKLSTWLRENMEKRNAKRGWLAIVTLFEERS